MIYHFGRNWTVPTDGEYTLQVRVAPPTFMRHDEVNGLRFQAPVDVEFGKVKVKRGQDQEYPSSPGRVPCPAGR